MCVTQSCAGSVYHACYEVALALLRPPKGITILCKVVTLGALLLPNTPANAQDNRLRGQFAIGVDIPEPRTLPDGQSILGQLTCEVVCSPFHPRQSIAQVSWPEPVDSTTPQIGIDLGKLRLDIVSGAGNFSDGEFATVRLSAVPVVQAQPDIGINLEDIRTVVEPTVFQPVLNSRILDRDPALPDPEIAIDERTPGVLDELPASARAALDRDAHTGGLGRMRVAGQAAEQRRSVPHRTVVIQGMQPGQTYKIRVMQESGSSANSIGQNICRIPVCPADFITD